MKEATIYFFSLLPNTKYNRPMKIVQILFIVLVSTLFYTCDADYEYEEIGGSINPQELPTQEEFQQLFTNAVQARIQSFTFDANTGYVNFTSEKNVQLTLDSNCLTYSDGNMVTGQVTLEYIEIFDKGSMLVTNKPTMGYNQFGEKELLLTGGEFYINLKQGEQTIHSSCSYSLNIPAALTGEVNYDMSLWYASFDALNNLTWEPFPLDNTNNGVAGEGDYYFAFLNQFGWCNVDVFYESDDPKTTIWVDVPDGYNEENSAVFLSYDGDEAPYGLAYLDTYDDTQEMFTEHYGLVPIGLNCHVIFISENNGNYSYVIQSQTIEADEIITINTNEFQTATESELVYLINALP